MRKTKKALAALLAGVITVWALSSSAVFAASPLPTPVKSYHFTAEIISNRLILPRVLTKDTVLPTKLDGSDITWTSSDKSVIAENGKITAPATGMSDVITLTAKISFKNQTESKEFHVQVMGQDGKSILGYTRQPDKSTVYDIRIADSLHLGYSEDDKTFEPLNHNYGILFAKADYSVNTVQGETKLLKGPYIFRMKDSGFGIIATRTDLKGNPDAPGKVLFFTSEDLINYTEVGMLTLDSAESEITGLSCEYDAAAGNYRIGWVGADGTEFYRTTSNFKTLSNMTEGPIFKANYAVGMVTADENADLTDPASWAKSGYAWMHSGSVEGEYGPGHNSFLIDEYGDVYNVYHAMFLNDNLRDASVRLVHFRADGSPILDMTAEEEILPANKTVRATVTVNASQEQKTFTLTVAAKLTDAKVVEDVKNQLEIPNANDIRGNITLPMELSASDGSGAAATITWATTNASIVDVNAEGSVPAGVVNRQAKDAHVTLTATIKSGKASGTKTFDLLVKAKANVEEKTAYLFGHFTGEGIDEEQIYFASSKDGNFWTDLNDRKPVLKSEIGMKGVRDPYIIRSHEGDKFYMLATDLSVRLQGWSNATSRGSRNLVIWESTDLVNWSEPWLSEVAVLGAGNAWAPEAIYDESTGEYVVFWASIVAGEAKNAKGEEQQRIFYSKTRDFRNFTPAQLYIARQKEDGSYTHIIDTTIIKAKGKYYRASADGQITIEESDSILGEWKRLFNLRELFNDNWKLDGNQVEGPEFFKYNKDDQKVETWGLLVDQYRSGEGYLPLLTTDISDATGEKWRMLNKDAGEYSFDQLKKRHGTILPITEKEYNAIMTKWGR